MQMTPLKTRVSMETARGLHPGENLWAVVDLLRNLDKMRGDVAAKTVHRWGWDTSNWHWVVEWMPRYLRALARAVKP